MEALLPILLSVLSAGCIAYAFTQIHRVLSQHVMQKQPPGPRGWPFVGYLSPIQSPAWITYRQWSDDYGSGLLSMNILGTNVMIANSLEVATDLLEARSAIYSDRPTFGITMLRDLVGFDWNIAVAGYGKYWRDCRKAFSHGFHTQAIVRYRPAMMKATYKFLRDLIENPEDFRARIKYLAGGQILHIAYGLEINDHNDPWIASVERAVIIATKCMVPGSFLVDLVPVLKYLPEWFPGAGFKTQARKWRIEAQQAVEEPFAAMKARIDLPQDSAARSLLENMSSSSHDQRDSEKVLKGTLASMYIAGADTTTSTLDTFFLAMAQNPSIIREAQRSVDRVCVGRLPTFADYDTLPWIHAIVKECLRWAPVVPLNFAHRAIQDDTYKGYHIPKGSLVLTNNWAILHDAEAYSDPEAFNPKRFLRVRPGTVDDSDVELDPNVRDPMVAVFGFGRRICPGRHMACDSLWGSIAAVVAAFDIVKAVDEDGEEVDVAGVGYTDGFLSFPKEFKCAIRPRSPTHAKLVYAALEHEQ